MKNEQTQDQYTVEFHSDPDQPFLDTYVKKDQNGRTVDVGVPNDRGSITWNSDLQKKRR